MNKLAIAAFVLALATHQGRADDDKQALEYGRDVQAVNRYLEYIVPEKPTAADKKKAEELRTAAVSAGHTTAMYLWVRSRLEAEVEKTQDWLRDTKPAPAADKILKAKILDIQKVIYEIDAPK